MKEAEADHDAALAIQKQLVADFPNRPDFRQDLAKSHNNRGNLLSATGRLKEAQAEVDSALAIQKQLVADFPNRPEFRQALGKSHNNRAVLASATGRLKEAEAEFDAALAIYKPLTVYFANQPELRNDVSATYVSLAVLHRHRVDLTGAKRLLLEGQPHHMAALAANPRHPTYRQCYQNRLMVLTEVQAGLLEPDEALRTAEARRDVGWDPPADAYDAACYLGLCIPIVAKHDKLDEGKRKEAAQFYTAAALKMLREAVSKGYKDATHMRKNKDLGPLRQYKEFQKLLADLEKMREKK